MTLGRTLIFSIFAHIRSTSGWLCMHGAWVQAPHVWSLAQGQDSVAEVDEFLARPQDRTSGARPKWLMLALLAILLHDLQSALNIVGNTGDGHRVSCGYILEKVKLLYRIHVL